MTVNLTYWLRKSPQPAVVLADEQRIEVPRNRRAFRDLTETIKALDPCKLTCLDAKGNVIRSLALATEDEPAVAPLPGLRPDEDPLEMFARLLAQGYENGRSAAQPLLDAAMQFVERQGERLARAEAENERLRMHIHKLNARIVDLSAPDADGGGGDDGIVGAIVAGMQAGAAAGGGASITQLPGAKK